MNNRKHISISCNFLLVSILWRGFLLYQLPDSCIGGNNPFNGIGGFCTLDLCDFNQFLQFIRAQLQGKLLLTSLFIDCSNKPKDLRIPFLILDS